MKVAEERRADGTAVSARNIPVNLPPQVSFRLAS
jgi:hypothetical protein